MEPISMSETTMNPTTRTLEKVTVKNAKKMVAMFDKWMGTEVGDRKEYIEQHLNEFVKDLD